ncbi:glycosyltransferase [Pendulispora brunnea]|uniref:Glycosyltransferase n=1 Tax=Pendulispora brunnea TaxID=2905690 RepID=A0ABZ2JWX5_9BACT
MKIVIITVGSLGDTAPFIGLGARLRAAGHDVAVAAQASFEGPIRDAGLEFRKMPGDIRADLASEMGQKLHKASSWLKAFPATLWLAEKILSELAEGIVAAAEGAELLIVHRIALMHGHLVANAMKVPCLVLELFPSGLAPTGEFLPAGFGPTSLGGWGNRAVYQLMRASAGKSKKYIASLEEFQTKFGLPRVDPATLYERMDSEQWPIYHAFSPSVVPRPADWREGLEVIGYFWPVRPRQWEPPAQIVDFLGSGPPPVFIGFGSLVPDEAGRLSELVTKAVRQAKVRAIVQAGWGNLQANGGDDILAIGSVPHDWLFPKMAAVVHAAGAGVTAAGLRAGVPAIPVPAMNDQPFWADRLVKLGVSPGAIRFQKLSAERLAFFIGQAITQPTHRSAALSLAERIRTEDGAGRIVQVVSAIDDGRVTAA